MDSHNIILYGDFFFNHIIYDIGLHETLNLLFVNKKFNKVIVNRWIDQICWKLSLFEGLNFKQVRNVLTKKNTILTGKFVVSCLYDLCSKDQVTILNVGTWNPYKQDVNRTRQEDYEKHRFDHLSLKIQCVNNWEYGPIIKVIRGDDYRHDQNMNIWIDGTGNVEGPAIIMGKMNSVQGLWYSRPFESEYSDYNFLSINKNHSYLKTFELPTLYPEFDHFVKSVKRDKLQIYDVCKPRYFLNRTTGQLDDVICDFVNSDSCLLLKRDFGTGLYKVGEAYNGYVILRRAELCDNDFCPLKRYGGISEKHYHFFDNKGGDYEEYVFRLKETDLKV